MTIKIAFIVPYRNREQQKEFFLRYMKWILEDYKKEDYIVVFSHQQDNRPFNRGAVKNIGFKYIKNKYPNHYKNISLVFHDIDVMSSRKGLFNYETENKIVKHFYGFDFALGGIISIKGSDFENSGGYPNYWSWSLEDNCLQKRVLKTNLKINRNVFYKIGDPNLLHIHDGLYKDYSETNLNLFKNDTGSEGLKTIYKLKTNEEYVDETKDHIAHYICNIENFDTLYDFKSQIEPVKHKLSDGNQLGKHVKNRKMRQVNTFFRGLVYK